MANRDILAIGTSAGGFDALRFLAGEFSPDFPASVLVVIHLPSQFRSTLDAILTQAGPLPASFAVDGEKLEKSRIYIAPPQRHLLVDSDRLRLGSGPRENNARPALDPLFRSAARCCAPRSVGAVLTGTLGDGAAGLSALKQFGGITVVQDPGDAAFPEMPTNALMRSRPDHVVGLSGMPALFEELVRQPAGQPVPVTGAIDYEVNLASGGQASMSEMDRIGRRSVLACPDCHGVMWEIDEGELIRYRCHVGHAYTAELMSLALDDNLRRALSSALRALDERIALARKLEREASLGGRTQSARSWASKVREFEQEAKVIRDSIGRTDEIAARFAE
ncbi:two-component system chemotaxis response regulator CheB [Bradyrhizobium macuxiense]|uniref:protein-glutamate methylesterase n=1 Tax=Bradyrhizobium macuxiense TaxID=1755647 RepID=A0A560LLG5_9BRAD|nr:chemotaxis protein CheB [Bradyrhizobium macuxiense]TWB96115.1 two-component system chemotaxis response regulator CheB [Bradyrhizobium macuxiense]